MIELLIFYLILLELGNQINRKFKLIIESLSLILSILMEKLLFTLRCISIF